MCFGVCARRRWVDFTIRQWHRTEIIPHELIFQFQIENMNKKHIVRELE